MRQPSSKDVRQASTAPTALLRRLLAVAPRSRRAVALAGVSAVVSTLCVLGQAVALGDICGSAFSKVATSHGGAWVLFGVALTVRALIALVQPVVLEREVAPVRRRLRARLLTSVTSDPAADRLEVDEVVLLGTRGVDGIGHYLTSYLPALVTSIAAPVVVLCWLAATDLMSSVIVISTVVVLPIFMVLLGLEAKDQTARRWRDLSTLAGHFGDVVRGLPTLKAHNAAERSLDGLDRSGEQLRLSSMATLKVALLSGFALELLSSLAVALVALTLGLRLLGGHLSLSVALAILIVTPEVYLPLRNAAARFHAATDGVAASMILLDRLEAAPPLRPQLVVSDAPVVDVANVVLSRTARPQSTTEDITFTVPAGKTAVVVGPSGVGKSTLLGAIGGLIAPAAGRITLDGVVVGTDARISGIGLLPQDPALPGRTVREALCLDGGPHAEGEMLDALRSLGLDLDLDFVLGDHAATLSAGQKRRLGLCRVLLQAPRLLLLDEPDAHLDEAAAHLVARAIHNAKATVIVVTHTPSLYRADVVVSLAREVTHGLC